MKRISLFTKFLACVLMVFVCVFFVGCSKDEEELDYSGHPIIGSWRYYYENDNYDVGTCFIYVHNYKLTFKKNGKGNEITKSSAKVVGSSIACMLDAQSVGTSINQNQIDYKIENNLLKGDFLGTQINHYITFSRNLDTLFLGNEYVLVRSNE